MPIYTELQVTSHFSFLRGASSCEELFVAAYELGYSALGIADHGTLAGMVRAHQAAQATGLRLVVGTRVDLDDGLPLLLYPTDRPAYSRLCRLLSAGKARAGKGGCRLSFADLAEWSEGLLAVLLPDEADAALARELDRLRGEFGDRAYLALSRRFRPGDDLRLHELEAIAARARVPTVVTGDVLYHAPERRILQDVVTCIRLGCTIDTAGFSRERFADRHLKAPEEMARLFARHPGALARTEEITARCRFSLAELRYQYPHEVRLPGLTAQQALERFTWEAAARRYPGGVPEQVQAQLRHELTLIAELDYAPYFLTVFSIVRHARQELAILCQGRGSAANSAVCYVLGITSIDPERHNLLFERFVSQERKEPPDIDVDFEHERREEVIQWIYDTYGRDRAALCATVIRYRSRGAVRDVGKVLGVPEDVLKGLAGLVWGWSTEGVSEKDAAELNLNLADRRLQLTLDLARQLIGVPRHLSQHPGGFVLTEDRLDDLVPIEPAAMENRQVIEWDKDDIDALKFMKVDVLGLGMLGCMRRCFDLLAAHKGERLDLATIPAEDPATYRMIQRADTIGVFQIESRAQQAMLPRMKPKTFYDLVIEVAIVRPGPIQGDMVHPYLRRREGREPVEYPRPELEAVLGKTLGVPLFQEQAMRVAIECAGFTPSEADALRRSMATFKFTGGVSAFRDKLVAGMVARGYSRDFADRTFRQLEGFGSYGFPESHAASFALIAYASSWMKCHHPDVFACAILNAQPMGFYAPAQLVRDAREHGVEVRAVDVNASAWDCTLEGEGSFLDPYPSPPAKERPHSGARLHHPPRAGEANRRSADGEPTLLPLRLGLRLAKGLAEAHGRAIVAARAQGRFVSVEDLWRRAGVPVAALEKLAEADAFASLGLSRRQALWAIRALGDEELPLFAAAAEKGGLLAERAEGPGPEPTAGRAAEQSVTPHSPRDGEAGSARAPSERRAGRDGDGGELGPETPGPFTEPPVALPAMTAGREVVEDYRSTGLSLRRHPVAFLRADLARAGMAPCKALEAMPNGRRAAVAGLVLVRQKPGSAKGVMFITLEDETGIANLVVWPQLFERQRRVVLAAGMMGVRGKVQREGEVIHLVAHHLTDLSELLRRVGERGEDFPLPHSRGDEARGGGGPPEHGPDALGRRARDIYIPDLRLGSGIKVPTRDFR